MNNTEKLRDLALVGRPEVRHRTYKAVKPLASEQGITIVSLDYRDPETLKELLAPYIDNFAFVVCQHQAQQLEDIILLLEKLQLPYITISAENSDVLESELQRFFN